MAPIIPPRRYKHADSKDSQASTNIISIPPSTSVTTSYSLHWLAKFFLSSSLCRNCNCLNLTRRWVSSGGMNALLRIESSLESSFPLSLWNEWCPSCLEKCSVLKQERRRILFNPTPFFFPPFPYPLHFFFLLSIFASSAFEF